VSVFDIFEGIRPEPQNCILKIYSLEQVYRGHCIKRFVNDGYWGGQILFLGKNCLWLISHVLDFLSEGGRPSLEESFCTIFAVQTDNINNYLISSPYPPTYTPPLFKQGRATLILHDSQTTNAGLVTRTLSHNEKAEVGIGMKFLMNNIFYVWNDLHNTWNKGE